MSPTLALSGARLKVTEVRFDKPAARNISPESSRPFPFASVRESETPLLRLIGRLERVPFPDEPPACTKKRTSEIAGAGPNLGRTSILEVNVLPKVCPGERRFTWGLRLSGDGISNGPLGPFRMKRGQATQGSGAAKTAPRL